MSPWKPALGVTSSVFPLPEAVPCPTCTEASRTTSGSGKGLVVYSARFTSAVCPALILTRASVVVTSGFEDFTIVTGMSALTAPDPSSTLTVIAPTGPLGWSFLPDTVMACPSSDTSTPPGTFVTR